MKLNPDCVRDILLTVESLKPKYYIDLRKHETDFDIDEYVYAGKKLVEAGYLKGNVLEFISGELDAVTIRELTMRGHELLDNIRDSKVWAETKSTISKVGSASLSVISQIAASIITAYLLK